MCGHLIVLRLFFRVCWAQMCDCGLRHKDDAMSRAGKRDVSQICNKIGSIHCLKIFFYNICLTDIFMGKKDCVEICQLLCAAFIS